MTSECLRRAITPLLCLHLITALGCASNVASTNSGSITRSASRIERAHLLMSRARAELRSQEFGRAMAHLREACSATPGEAEIHWLMAQAALGAAEREVGYRALKVLVNIDPARENDSEVLSLARDLADLPNIHGLASEEMVYAENRKFSWSDFYRPKNPLNLN